MTSTFEFAFMSMDYMCGMRMCFVMPVSSEFSVCTKDFAV